jgi:hypothetical protein
MPPTLPHVQPGQLVRAQLINDMLDFMGAIETRLSALEAGSSTPAAGSVVISQVSPLSVRQGETLTVSGHNFGWTTGATSVVLDGQLITAIASGSNSQLIFTVPDFTVEPPPTGRVVQLLVSNGASSASTSLTLLPHVATPEGEIDVDYIRTSPATPMPGSPLLVEFRLFSRRTVSVNLTLTPLVSKPWSPLRILSAGAPPAPIVPPQVTLFPQQVVSILVEVPLPSNTPTATPFQVGLGVEGPGVSAASTPTSFQVGSAAPQEADFIDVSTSLPGNAVTVARNAMKPVTITCEFSQTGNYDFTTRFGSAGAAGWQVDLSDVPHPIAIAAIPQGLPRAGWVPVPIHLLFTAPATLPSAQPLPFFIDVNKQGQTIKRTLQLNLTAT